MRAAILILVLAAAAMGCSTPRPAASPVHGSSLKVRDIEVGRAIGPDKVVTLPTGAFGPSGHDLHVGRDGRQGTDRDPFRALDVRGALLEETEQRIAPSGTVVSEFHVFNPAGWAPGEYRVEILLDGNVVGDRAFRVDPTS